MGADEIPKDVKEKITAARRELDLPTVDYEATLAAKLSIARELFDRKDHELLKVATCQPVNESSR